MRGREMLETIENLNPAYIEAAAEKPKAKKAGWLKWGAMAACLAVVVIAGISMLPGNNTVQMSIGGVMREYKNVSVASSEVAIEWPWEYKTLYERFSTIIYDGREYRHIGVLVFRFSYLEFPVVEIISINVHSQSEQEWRTDQRCVVFERHVQVLDAAQCHGISVHLDDEWENLHSAVRYDAFYRHMLYVAFSFVLEQKFPCQSPEHLVVLYCKVITGYPHDSVDARDDDVHAGIQSGGCCQFAVELALE